MLYILGKKLNIKIDSDSKYTKEKVVSPIHGSVIHSGDHTNPFKHSTTEGEDESQDFQINEADIVE